VNKKIGMKGDGVLWPRTFRKWIPMSVSNAVNIVELSPNSLAFVSR